MRAIPLAILACVVSFFGGALTVSLTNQDISCSSGEVYVMDTQKCVSGTDHASH